MEELNPILLPTYHHASVCWGARVASFFLGCWAGPQEQALSLQGQRAGDGTTSTDSKSCSPGRHGPGEGPHRLQLEIMM